MKALAAVGLLIGVGHVGAAPTNCTRDPVITLDVYRHAFSCENTLVDCNGILCKAAVLGMEKDGPISDNGVASSKVAAEELKKAKVTYDVILSSSQLRTTETALYQFPGKTVYQVPYVKEIGPLDGELPATIEVQKEKMKELGDPLDRVNFDYVEEWGDDVCNAFTMWTVPRCEADWGDFMEWFAETLVEKPMPEIKARLDKCQDVRVALMTHSVLMKTFTRAKSDGLDPGNTGYGANFTLGEDKKGNPALIRVDGNRKTPWVKLSVPDGEPNACPDGEKPVSPDAYKRCLTFDAKTFEAAEETCWS